MVPFPFNWYKLLSYILIVPSVLFYLLNKQSILNWFDIKNKEQWFGFIFHALFLNYLKYESYNFKMALSHVF